MLRLTQEHVDRALRIAHWYGRGTRRAELSDLESAALEGLAKAARDWDPDRALRRKRLVSRKRSFWSFACTKILGEMRDELRRLDHLTRDQRALVAEDGNGELTVEHEDLRWINPQEPMPLDAAVPGGDGETAAAIVDLIEEPNDPIEGLALRDAFCRASAALPERERLVLLMRDLEGYSNTELAEAFQVTEGRASQLRGAALNRMRDEIGDSFLDAA
ncbi:MAG TPA: sigma-70 family RNA polymerase sigma factor [Gaiellaceae bacterium]|nr:sigma-70 family RNA polymerase sigma factor [Gaiellaceae bacterium]